MWITFANTDIRYESSALGSKPATTFKDGSGGLSKGTGNTLQNVLKAVNVVYMIAQLTVLYLQCNILQINLRFTRWGDQFK